MQPYTYEELQRVTKIHRNTLKLRLDQLVKDNIIINHHHNFRYNRKVINYTGGSDFYLLNWAEKQSREMVRCIFDNPLVRKWNLLRWCQYSKTRAYIISPSTSRLSYIVNSIHVEPSKRVYTIIQPGTLSVPSAYFLSIREFWMKISDLRRKEDDIFEQIRLCIAMARPVEERNRLIDKRDSILESIVLLYTRLAVPKYAGRNASLFHLDLLCFFEIMSIFHYWRPCVKFWEIVERVGY